MISARFLKSSLIYTVAGILPMASALILFPLYIYHLSVEAYGALSIYLVFITLVQILVTFSFDSSVYVHFHEYKNDRRKLADFVSSAFVFMLITGVVVALVLLLLGEMIFRIALPDQDISFYPYGLVSAATGVFLAVFRVHSSLLQTREKPETFLWSNVMVLSLIVIFTWIGLQLRPHSLAGPLYGRMLGCMIPFLWVLWRIFREFGMRFNFRWLRSSFGFNFYSFIYQLQQWLINHFDRVLMLLFLSLSDVGVYDFAIKCLIPIELLMNSLHGSFFPRVVAAMSGKAPGSTELNVNRYYYALIAVVMILVVGSILFLPVVVTLVVQKKEYLAAVEYIPYLAVVYLFRAIRLYFAFPYSTMKFTRPLPLIYLIVVVIKVGLIVALVGQTKLYAPVIASLASAAIEVWLLSVFMRRRYEYQFNIKKLILMPMVLMLTVLILEPLMSGGWLMAVHVVYCCLCLAMLAWVYRGELVALIRQR